MHLVTGQDIRVAEWMFNVSKCRPMLFNLAVGIEDDVGNLVGGIMFTGFNGSDAEVHFVGVGRLKRRTVRAIFAIALKVFNLNRLTVHTRKEHMSRGVLKLGAVFECEVRRLYGPTDSNDHTGKRYVFFRETMMKLAGLSTRETEV
jgi:hypothetical protein